jgi:hypothetical protein
LQLSLVLSAIVFLALIQPPYIEAQDRQNFLVVNGDTANRQQVEPSIAIDPLNHDIIVASAQDMRKVPEFGDRWNSYYRSEDGGRTWKNDLIPGYPTDSSPGGMSSPLKQFQFISDPVVAFDSFGNAYFVGLAVNRNSGRSAVFVARYSNHGSTYNGTTLVAVGTRDAGISLDKPYLFVDNARTSPYLGNIYITWTEVNTRPSRLSIYFAKSTNMAESFSSPLLVSERLDFFNQFSAIATGPEGVVYVTWVSWDRLQTWIKLARSFDGFSFSTKTVAVINDIPNPFPNNGFRVMSFPAIAVDASEGIGSRNAYISWADWNGRDSDILLMRSVDEGETWFPPIRLNDEARNNQFMQAMIVADGQVFAVWYDSRLDTSSKANKVLDVYYSVSSDQGRSFSKNVRVTSSSFDPNAVCRCPVFSAPFLGDYISISSAGSNVVVIWTDNRNASPSEPLNQDVFVAYLEGRPSPNLYQITSDAGSPRFCSTLQLSARLHSSICSIYYIQ